MNNSKLEIKNDNSENYFVDVLAKIIPRQNGTQAGFNALAESLKRNDAYAEAQQTLNERCLPVRSQLSNTFLKEA